MRICVSPEFSKDLESWKRSDKKIAEKIKKLLLAIVETPCEGIGKPEPLKYKLSGCWSRRISREHRLIYRVVNDELQLISCRYRYS